MLVSQGIAIDEFPQMDGEYHPCTPSYKGPEKCNPAEHRTPEQVHFLPGPSMQKAVSAKAKASVCPSDAAVQKQTPFKTSQI